MEPTLSPLEIDPYVLALQVLGFALLYLVLKRLLFGPLLSVMRRRERQIDAAFAAGEEAKRQLAAVEAEREKVLAQAQEEAREQLRRATREAEQARAQILQKAREDGQRLRERARAAIALERERATAELRRRVVDLALLAASRAVLQRLDEQQHRQAVDDFIASLEQEP